MIKKTGHEVIGQLVKLILRDKGHESKFRIVLLTSKLATTKVFTRAEVTKKAPYGDRILNAEHETFTPLIYWITGGMGNEPEIYHKRPTFKH